LGDILLRTLLTTSIPIALDCYGKILKLGGNWLVMVIVDTPIVEDRLDTWNTNAVFEMRAVLVGDFVLD
jgi:hypothetical protein